MTLTQKIITHRVLKIHEWIWGDVYEWGQFLKPWQVTDKIIEWIFSQFTFNPCWPGPMMAPSSQPHSLTATLTLSTFNLISINYANVWLHTLNVVEGFNVNCIKIYSIIFPHSYTSPQNHLWIFKTLWFIIFWVWVTRKMLNVMHKKSLNNFICHLPWFKKLSLTHNTSPQNQSWIVKTLWVIIFWVRVTRKMLNVNWEKIHSIILYCHLPWLEENFPDSYTIPSKPVMNCQNPMSYYFLS